MDALPGTSRLQTVLLSLAVAAAVTALWAGLAGLRGGLVAAALLTAALVVALGLWLTRRALPARAQQDALFDVIARLPWALVMVENGRIAHVNPAAEGLLGFPKARLLGQPPGSLLAPESRDALARWMASATPGAPPTGLDVEVQTAEGPRPARLSGAHVVYAGRPLFEIQLTDRSEEARAHTEAERLAAFLRLAPEPVVEIQPDGRVSFANRAALDALPGLAEQGARHPYFARLPHLRETLEGGALTGTAHCEVEGRLYDQVAFFAPDGQALRLYGRDVTGREEARQALRASEGRFNLLFHLAPVGLSISRLRDGLLIEVNNSFARFLGYDTPDQIAGRTAVEIGMWADINSRPDVMAKLEQEGSLAPHVIEVRTRDGGTRHALAAAERIDFNGEPCVVGILLDMEERETLRAHVEAERDFARSVIETVGQGLLVNDADFRIQFANQALLDMTGYTLDEVRQADPISFLEPETARRIAADREARRHGAGAGRYETRIRCKDGTFLDVLLAAVPRLVDGAYVGTTTIVVDISEQKRILREIDEFRAFYENILHDLPIDVVVMTPQGRFMFMNRSAVRDDDLRLRLFGHTVEEYPRLRGLDPALYQQRQAWVESVVAAKKEGTREETIETPDGPRHILRTARPVLDGRGDVQYVIGYALDVTERRTHEAQLIRARDEAENLNLLKSSFIANMSHEVRTPLTAVIGFAEVLEDELEAPHLRELAALIRESGARLLETLNSVLDLARMEAGALDLACRPADVGPLVATTVALFGPLADARGITLETDLPPAPILARVDVPAFNRIVGNLVSNAVKFTEKGGVRVEVARAGDEVAVRVRDTGVGMDADFISVAFEEFRQESAGLARSHTGAGLGLAIVRRLAEMMQGRVAIESRRGEGTTVTVTLPAA